ncbi:MAG TPA: helix-turn-helix domain-containing protein [Candidatus Thermoplasmatota archaeon]|nr:helix-turn-helix domain-containing protein [Candidatus Thermoplasmatota archaeon]
MPVTDARIARLREFGLSEYAARAYLALLDLGVTEARDVSALGKVPTSKIYHVLDQLHAKGLVEILPEFPKKYAPLPFAAFLDALTREHETAVATIRLGREKLEEEFRIFGDADVGDRGAFSVIRGRRNVMAKIREIMSGAESEVFVLGTPRGSSRVRYLNDVVNDVVARGVKIRVLSPITPDSLPRLLRFANRAEIRGRTTETAEGLNVGIYIADNRRALVVTFVPDDESPVAGKDVGFITDQAAVVASLMALLEPQWAKSPELALERRIIEEGAERPFTNIISGEKPVRDAHAASLARGARRIRYASAMPQRILTEVDRANTTALVNGGVTLLVITNIDSIDALRSIESFGADISGAIEWRHLDPDAFSRFTIYDDREALFSVGPTSNPTGNLEGEVWIHTNNPTTVKALCEAFDRRWSDSVSLEQRRRELEIFPRVTPRAVGIGRLFDSIRDAVVVADAEGRILFGNAAAQSLMGWPRRDLAKLTLGDIFPDGLPETPILPTGSPDAPVLPAKARLKDGVATVEVTQTRFEDGTSPLTVVMARNRSPLPKP